MSQDEFTKLFRYVQDMNTRMEEGFAATASRDSVETLYDRFDAMEKRLSISEDERLVMGYQISRLDRWTHELADKIGHELAE